MPKVTSMFDDDGFYGDLNNSLNQFNLDVQNPASNTPASPVATGEDIEVVEKDLESKEYSEESEETDEKDPIQARIEEVKKEYQEPVSLTASKQEALTIIAGALSDLGFEKEAARMHRLAKIVTATNAFDTMGDSALKALPKVKKVREELEKLQKKQKEVKTATP